MAPRRKPTGRRRYDSSGRAAASAATRARIIEAAHDLFLTRGYRETTIAAIARASDVHVDTIYTLVGRKADLASVLIEHALAGTDRVVPARDRAYVAAILAEPDPGAKIDIYARATAEMLERVAPLHVALRDAAAEDPSAAELWRSFSDRRAANMREFVADVAAAGALPPGFDVELAADTVWATNSPELYVLLTGERGWSNERFRTWLAATWRRVLIA